MKTIYLAGGCFWGTQHFVRQLKGVVSTRVGYANGSTDHPTYEQVKHEHTGHAETVEVVYDETVLPTRELLSWYFMTIDPLSVNRQGEDEGGVKFERIRRITGYLVGTLERFNDAKRAEERDRVRHI